MGMRLVQEDKSGNAMHELCNFLRIGLVLLLRSYTID